MTQPSGGKIWLKKLIHTLISAYNALIKPHFDSNEVCDTLGIDSASLSNRLQKVQNKAAMVVLRLSNDTPEFEA